MSINCERILANAQKKIAENGQTVVFARAESESEYNPISGKNKTATRITEVQAVMLGIKAEDVGAGLIEAGDARLLVAGDALPYEPDSGVVVWINGQTSLQGGRRIRNAGGGKTAAQWRVIHSERIAPNGASLLWKLLIRRS